MIFLADATQRNSRKDMELTFFSTDTDVLVLAIANYDLLPKKTSIHMVSGTLQIKPFWEALGTEKAKALPACHVFSGADITGTFANIGKTTWFKIFPKTTTYVINALTLLSTASEVTDGIQSAIAKFVCAAYCPKSIQIFNIPELFFENTWLKVSSYRQLLELSSSTFYEYTCRQVCGARHVLLSRYFWIHCRMPITEILMKSLHQQQQISFQHPRQSSRW